jgi:AraC family transcriptional regulator, transcriptional activator of pobA
MIDYQEKSIIPEIRIKNFDEKNPGFVVTELKELYDKHWQIVINPHRICYYQVIVITNGNGTFWLDSNQYTYQPRSLFAISKGRVESFEIGKGTTGYALLFSEEFLCKYPGDMEWINNLLLFNYSIEPPLINVTDLEFPDFLGLMEKIKLEYDMDEDFVRNEIILNMLKTFLLLAERKMRNKIKDYRSEISDVDCLMKFKMELEKNYKSSRSVSFYSNLLCITPRKLNQITLNYWGKSTKHVIEERVLLETKRLLVHTNQTVKEIGNTLGFDDPTNFNKFFKKYIQKTPAEFRNLNKKKYLHR